jgi:probable F420-dependent oxidoreductase
MSDVRGVLSFTDTMSPAEVADYATRLEALGYEELWMPDLLGRELFTLAAFVLERTTRLRVASGISNIYGRDAMSTAQAARTLCELYDGRFILGLGVSHPQVAEMRGHTWTPPARMLGAYLEDIAACNIRSPEPECKAPIYIAAHGPKLLALAAKAADGANTYLMPPEHTRQAREILGPDKTLNIVLPCCLCDDAERARHVARKGLSVYLGLPAYQRQWSVYGFSEQDFADRGSDRLVDMAVAWGDEDAIRGRIDAYTDAGADQIQLVVYNPAPRARGTDWTLLEALAPGSC